MKLVKIFIKEFLYQIAHVYNLIGKTDNAITLFKKLNKLDPGDSFIYLDLVFCYTRKHNYEGAKDTLEEALNCNSDDWLLNRIFIELLDKTGEPMEKFVPYIKMYFKNKPTEHSQFPSAMKLFVKVLKPETDWDSHSEMFHNYLSEWDAWAENILKVYEHQK